MKNFNLQTMSETELTGLRNEIDAVLLGRTTGEASDVSHFYKCLNEGMDFLNGHPLPPLTVLKKDVPEAYEKLVYVAHYINQHKDKDGKMDPYQVYVTLITAYMYMLNLMANLSTFLDLHERFPTLLHDSNFDLLHLYEIPSVVPYRMPLTVEEEASTTDPFAFVYPNEKRKTGSGNASSA